MKIACLDFEGVLIPEIWINVAKRTGIDALKTTTRDVPDYDVLMRQRLRILDEHHIRLPDIQAVIAEMGPMNGAQEFVNWLRERHQVVLLSDTFYEFAAPLVSQFGHPTLLCHHLKVAPNGRIIGYQLRQEDSKRAAIKAFRSLCYTTIATGDSYNDTTMLAEADAGILFSPPDNVVAEFPQFPVARNYEQLRQIFSEIDDRLG